MRGTSKYLTGKSLQACAPSQEFPVLDKGSHQPKKIKLLEGFAFNPESSSKSASTSLMTCTELREAAEKINKSSTKHR
jgi:hypothetical protein